MGSRSEYAVPGRITVALDAGGLDGPEVDQACGVAEPTVDLWEAGVLLPQPRHVRLLAELTGMAADYFYKLEPLPASRMFVCARRQADRSVVEPGELAGPVCPDCGAVCWHAAPTRDGVLVLIDRPDPAYGSLVACVVGRTRTRPRRVVWGVRPVAAADHGGRHLLRRPHACPAWPAVCAVPGPGGAGVCGEPARPYPGGPACAVHTPAGDAATRFARG